MGECCGTINERLALLPPPPDHFATCGQVGHSLFLPLLFHSPPPLLLRVWLRQSMTWQVVVGQEHKEQHLLQCNPFTKQPADVREGLANAVTTVSVDCNTDKS